MAKARRAYRGGKRSKRRKKKLPEITTPLIQEELKPGPPNPDVTILKEWTEVERGVTMTCQRCRRQDGSVFVRYLNPEGFMKSWREEGPRSLPWEKTP